MQNVFIRGNTVFTFALIILGFLCSFASYSERLHRSNPQVDLEVSEINHLWSIPVGPLKGNDEASFSINITADLRSVFSWNTKQIFVFICAEYVTPRNSFNQVTVWDTIITRKEDAWIDIPDEVIDYNLMDQGNHLRGLNFNLTMYWSIMPHVGGLATQKQVFTGFTLPEEYTHGAEE